MRILLACLFALNAVVVQAERWQWDFELPMPQGSLQGNAEVLPIGPSGVDYVGMPEANRALRLDGKGDYVRVADDAEHGSLDFLQGDPITLEAWVRLDQIGSGQNVYIVGKGRTHRDGPKDNQNYALRLRSVGGQAALSFLFRSEATDKQPADWHRWTSKSGMQLDGMWHHVAVTYRFGEPDSIRGVLNGKSLSGSWDMGGATRRPPVVDDDEVWIGSSMGAASGSSFQGGIDHVVIARRITPVEEYAKRRIAILHPPSPPVGGLVEGAVAVTLYENVGSNSVMPSRLPPPLVRYTQSAFGFSRVPVPYALDGVRRDWKGPSLLVAMAEIDLPAGELQWMLRGGGLSRLWIGNELVAETPKHLGSTGGHGEVEPYHEPDPWLRPLHPGHREEVVTHQTTGGPTVVALQSMIGGKGYRYEAGEIMLAYRADDSQAWQLLSLDRAISLTDEDWAEYEHEHQAAMQRVDDRQRRATAASEDAVWLQRHQQARQFIRQLDPIELPNDRIEGDQLRDDESTNDSPEQVIDRLIDAGLRVADAWDQRTPSTSDGQFLRRLYLDCVGVVPSPEELRAFEALSSDPVERRVKVIDLVLEDSRWAGHWTAYWMDVLGENASVLKPSLNNSGPFRWFLYDKLRDNVAVDRWVTGLLKMQGSELFGGSAGFAMAAENDVPMAAKAHVATSAFLGVNMKCARCHDAPYHDWTQRDLFSLAAMLERKPLEIPVSSSVPAEFFEGEEASESLITLSVVAGDRIEPAWSLNRFIPDASNDQLSEDSRHRFAYQLTRVENRQFAKTIVNRLWKQLLGQGIVEPVEDWEGADPSHPKLLDYLARELVTADFDFKHVARLILHSNAYQRQSIDEPIQRDETKRHFAAPQMRRMTAEQLVDSMHAAVGRAMDCDELTFDPEARMKPTAQNNLGKPRRAWQLTSLSNERDRPALSLPRAAAVAECMEAFGWTGSRQEPTNHRQVEPNVIQPGVLANGLLSIQLTVVADGDHLADDAIAAESVDALVSRLFERFLTRQPTRSERAQFSSVLRPGFGRRVLETPLLPETPIREPNVSWANHLHPVATEVRLRQAERLRAGPMPSRLLQPAWRQQMEDVVWALVNTPEFLFIP
ncbi:MAG: DUF1553 domain-containing protein [Rubripirellula sp.]|nr:DUF1553 domain-containing protein [Rubripirellula sp.]